MGYPSSNLNSGLSVAADFPLLQPGGGGEGLVYLDNAATTHKPACVLAAMDSYYRMSNANPHRSAYRLARRATDAYEQARATVARFIGAEFNEVVFTSGTTHALNTVAHGLGISLLKPGDEIVLSVLEHHSNLVPWQTVAKQVGAKIVYLVPDAQGRISDEEIDRVVGSKTRVVAVAHVSNVLGCMLPVEHIVQAAHDCGAVVVLDCAQSIAHIPVDVKALDVDFAAFSGHKMYGPMGTGVLYGTADSLATLSPLMQGGGMIDDVFEATSTLVSAPLKFEAGTQNVVGAVGLAAAIEYLKSLEVGRIRSHERALTRRMLEGLAVIPSVRVYGDADGAAANRIGIVPFNVKGIEAADAAHALDCRSVAIRAGAHCAQPLIRHLRERAVCRASLAIYNNEADIDAFLTAVEFARKDVVATMVDNMV